MKLTVNTETLQAISDIFDDMQERAESIFKLKEKIQRVGMKYSEHYHYDKFTISDGCIALHGSYSYRCGEYGEIDFSVRFEDFADENYIDRLQKELDTANAEFEKKEIDKEKQKADELVRKEKEELARLLKKYKE
jgi:alpha-glucosidase (family GH31 glycosyl hydrolase)